MIAPPSTATILPADYTPSQHSVIIGRSRDAKEAIGNKRLRVLVQSFLPQYSQAINRNVKSHVVSQIVDMVRDACPVGAFIKKVGQFWVEVDDSVAREKVGYTFRDLLCDQYRSSSKSKALKRQKDQERAQKASCSSPSSSFSDYMRMACTVKEQAVTLGPIPTSLFELDEDKKKQQQTAGAMTSENSIDYHVQPSFSSSSSSAASYYAKTNQYQGHNEEFIANNDDEPIYVPPLRRKSDIEWMEMMNFKLRE